MMDWSLSDEMFSCDALLIVDWHFHPGEIEGIGHAFVTDVGECGPTEWRKSAVAGGGTGDEPVEIG